MISLLNALFLKEDPPRGHALREVDPIHRRSLVRLRAWIRFHKVPFPQCHVCLRSMGHFLDTVLWLPLRPQGKGHQRALLRLLRTPIIHDHNAPLQVQLHRPV